MAQLTLNDVQLQGNRAGRHGGCFHLEGRTSLSAVNVVANNNAANGNGGFLSMSDSNTNATASNSSDPVSITFTGVQLVNNTAGGSGGAMWVNNTNKDDPWQIYVTGRNSTGLLSMNQAAVQGGGIAVYGSVRASIDSIRWEYDSVAVVLAVDDGASLNRTNTEVSRVSAAGTVVCDGWLRTCLHACSCCVGAVQSAGSMRACSDPPPVRLLRKF